MNKNAARENVIVGAIKNLLLQITLMNNEGIDLKACKEIYLEPSFISYMASPDNNGMVPKHIGEIAEYHFKTSRLLEAAHQLAPFLNASIKEDEEQVVEKIIELLKKAS